MTSLQERLFAMQDKQYATFQAKLILGLPMESFIGIRVPVPRKFTKEFLQRRQDARNSFISFLTNTTMRTCFTVSSFPK